MRCPRCQQENRDEARFRAACGSLVAAQCPACGHVSPPEGCSPSAPSSTSLSFEWLSIYGAVGHTTGGRFFLGLPYLDAEMFQHFVDAFAQAFRASLNLLLLDNSGAPTAQRLTLPENVRLVFLPAYCPELNPIERVWRDLKDALA